MLKEYFFLKKGIFKKKKKIIQLGNLVSTAGRKILLKSFSSPSM